MNLQGAPIAIAVLCVAGTAAVFELWRTLVQVDTASPQVTILGGYSPVLTWLKYKHRPAVKLHRERARAMAIALVEIGIITVWALCVGFAYLNLDPTFWPSGFEFAVGVQSHYVWTLLPQCGACVLWNGFTNGGVPAFVEMHGSVLHPLVILTTLIWGVVNGSKVILVVCLALAGIAQWWQAQVLRLGRVARLWSGCMAVAGGHLASRMQLGLVPLVLSLTMCSLLMSAVLDLALTGRKRGVVVVGVLLALTLVAGQGYYQIGLALSLLPALLVLLWEQPFRLNPIWKKFVLAGALALLLTAIWWVPLAHFLPNFAKEINPAFETVQPIAYSPLNLVVGDVNFYRSDVLHKFPYPWLYADYIGWLPILLAAIAWRFVPRSKLRLLAFFLIAIVLVYLNSSALTFKLFALVLPDTMAGIRQPPLIAALAVPLVLGLAAWGLDLLLKLDWPKLTVPIGHQNQPSFSFGTSWLVLAVPLLWSLQSSYVFAQNWLVVDPAPSGTQVVIDDFQKNLTPKAEWSQPPALEFFWLPSAMDAGLKIAMYFRPWHWKDREMPGPFLEAIRSPATATVPGYVRTVGGFPIVAHPENEYAFVTNDAGPIPCFATATGGDIDVDCQTDAPGQLIVRENSWSGWQVMRDGSRVALAPGQWLSTSAPAGKHHYAFRYRPWDVTVGLALTALGLALSSWLWFRISIKEES